MVRLAHGGVAARRPHEAIGKSSRNPLNAAFANPVNRRCVIVGGLCTHETRTHEIDVGAHAS